ncbi:MAG: NADH-quinone oxidoreductase subunit B [Syntrophobacteraceae bacterium]
MGLDLKPKGASPNILQNQQELDAPERLLGGSVILTKLQEVVNWGRKYSFFLYPFVTACCGMEFMSVAGPKYDLDRFGAALPRFSPRQADLLMVVGTISHKQAPILVKVYNQMTEPKWVFAFGVCAVSGGFYDNYSTVQGIDTLIPVDVYVPGCPPRPEMVIDGLLKLQEKVSKERWSDWPRGAAPVTLDKC